MTTLSWQMRGARFGSLALTLVLAGQCQLPASAQQVSPAVPPKAPVVPARPQFERVHVTAGRSVVVTTDFAVTRIAVTNPDIADAVTD